MDLHVTQPPKSTNRTKDIIKLIFNLFHVKYLSVAANRKGMTEIQVNTPQEKAQNWALESV